MPSGRSEAFKGIIKFTFPITAVTTDNIKRDKFAVILREVEVDGDQGSDQDVHEDKELQVFFWDEWARACQSMKPQHTLTLEGLEQDQLAPDDTQTPQFDFSLNARRVDKSGGQRSVMWSLPQQDNGSVEYEITDKNVETFRLEVDENTYRARKPRSVPLAPVYTKINELAVSKDKRDVYNVFGVVKKFCQPRETRGQDYNVFMTIADESSPGGVAVMFFKKEVSELPVVRAVGDVIRLHRVKVVLHAGLPQIQNRPGHSFVLFGVEGNVVTPYQRWPKGRKDGAVDETHAVERSDETAVRALAAWSRTALAGDAPAAAGARAVTGFAKRLSDVSALDSPFDLHGRLYREDARPDGGIRYFQIWDGTDLSARLLSPDQHPPDAQHPPDGGSGKDRATATLGLQQSRSIDAPRVGSVLRIGVGAEHELVLAALDRLEVGEWVALRNMVLKKEDGPEAAEQGGVMGYLSQDTWVNKLQGYQAEVIALKKLYDNRIRATESAGPDAPAPHPAGASGGAGQGGGVQGSGLCISLVTSAGFGAAPMSSIREILDATKENPVGKFRCCVDIADVSPPKVDDFVSWSHLRRTHVCLFSLTLKDDTASLTATVAYEDFEEFTGVAQSEMRTPQGLQRCADVITTLRQPGPRAELCLKTCQGRQGELVYRVFATTVLSAPRVVPQVEGRGREASNLKRKRQTA